MARPGFGTQLSTLLDRTLLIYLGSPTTLLIMMVQPPLVGAILGAAWRNQEPTNATWLCMAIAAIYIGAMNSAAAIVRERAILERERMFRLSIWAYLLSKIMVLAGVCVAQMALLLTAQSQLMHLPAGVGNHLLLGLALTLAAVCATGLGLAISAFARSTYVAVLLVPILIIPQIVFTEVVLKGGIDRQIPEVVEKVTITKWGYEALHMVGTDGEWGTFVGSTVMMLLLLALFLLIAALKLRLDDV